MLKHMVVLAVAVATALSAAQEIVKVDAARAASRPMAMAQSTAPPEGDTPSLAAAEVSKSKDGHYWAEAEVDGRWIHCLVDTGASTVALTRADAARLGLDVQSLTYDLPVTTASGVAHAARVELAYVTVAGARVNQVPAVVVQDGLSASLLGMSYLGRLSRFEATPAALILRP